MFSSIISRCDFHPIFIYGMLITYRYAEIEKSVEGVEHALKLRNLSKTRWTARAESIRALWISYEEVKESLDTIAFSSKFDDKSRRQANNLSLKMESVDFIESIMFMKNKMYKAKKMTEALQSKELNVIDAMIIVECTVKSLSEIWANADEMELQIQAGISFTEKLGGHPFAEFQRKHRVKRQLRRIDENPETRTAKTIIQFFKLEFYKVLDVQIQQFGFNLSQCLREIKPFSILQPPLKEPSIEEINNLAKMFPENVPLDPSLHAEFWNFITNGKIIGKELTSVADAARYSEETKRIFPLSDRCYRLLMTAPVTVAKDERTFGRLKLVKTYLRTTMTDDRLNSLMLMSCEKDLTDATNIDVVAACWAKPKHRRIKC